MDNRGNHIVKPNLYYNPDTKRNSKVEGQSPSTNEINKVSGFINSFSYCSKESVNPSIRLDLNEGPDFPDLPAAAINDNASTTSPPPHLQFPTDERLNPICPPGTHLDDEILPISSHQRLKAGLESVEALFNMKPREYRSSAWWKKLRGKVLVAYGSRCIACRETATEVHHLSYLNLGKERWCDVVALCHKHHRLQHHPEDKI